MSRSHISTDVNPGHENVCMCVCVCMHGQMTVGVGVQRPSHVVSPLGHVQTCFNEL